jgi:hypothetical protein
MRLSLVLLFLSAGCSAALAQDLGGFVGTVTDSSGALIPDATVTISNADKGFARQVVSNTSGEYVVPRAPLGAYIVTVEKAGFQKLIRTGVTLSAGDTLRLDFTLQIGSVSEQISVNSTAAKVDTESGALSDVVTGSQVSQLNLNARNFANLATLVPGAASLSTGFDPSSVGVLANATISFNGVPGNFNNWEIDSTNNVDQGSGSNSLMVYPSIDSIAEFRISTSNYSAEYGKSGGANIEVVTKSGTRDFHGDAFEFVRNDKFDANDWFINRTITGDGSSAPKTPLKRNNFGFTLGGPVYIPRHYNVDRNKTFFFVSEEWRKNREGTVIDKEVPTIRMRQGDFSECDTGSSNYNPVVASGCALPINPATGTNYRNNVVPVSATASALLNGLIPLPNNGVNRYTAAPSLPTNFREDMFRVDHNFTDNIRLFVRYTQDAYEQDFVPTLWSSADFGTVKSTWTSPAKSFVAHLTQTMTPNLLNEVIVSVSADVNTVNNSLGSGSPANLINKPSDFEARTIFPASEAETKLPGINVSGGVPFSFAESTGFEFFFWDPQPQIKDNLIWSKGKHTLKFGAYLRKNFINTTTNIGLNTQGFLTFSNSSPLTTGNALADMFVGRIASYEEYGRVVNGGLLGGAALGHWRQWDFEPYFQDDWRVTSKLTLNLGVRYYWLTPFHDATRPTNDSIFILSQYNPANQAQLDSGGYLIPGTGANYLNYGNGLAQCGSGSVPEGCFRSYRGTISPRFGFAWDPFGTGKMVLRGGYALNWDSSNPLQGGAGFNGNPPTATALLGYNILGYNNVGPGPLGPANFSNVPQSQKWPEVQQYSFGIQQRLPDNTILTASYVGSLGRHLQRSRNINQVPINSGIENVPSLAGTTGCDAAGNCNVQDILINTLQSPVFFVPYRGYATISQRESTGNSNYNSLQINLRHNVGHNLTFQAAYTWSHTLDDIVSNQVDDSNMHRWYGTSSLNQTHILSLNYIYSLPFFANSKSRWLRATASGWEISGISSFMTGPPIDTTCGIAGMATGIGGPAVCNSNGSLTVQKGTVQDPQFGATQTWFDPGALAQVAVDQLRADNQPGMFGYLGKNPIAGPGRNDWDLALMRNFRIGGFGREGSSLQFRLESYNAFNHPQWSAVNFSCSDQTAPGTPCNGSQNIGNGEVSAAYSPRILQLGLKFVF